MCAVYVCRVCVYVYGVCVLCVCEMSHIGDEAYVCHEWVVFYVWMNHVTRVKVSGISHTHTHTHVSYWVMHQVWMSQSTCVNASCLTFECLMSNMWMSQFADKSYVWRIHMCGMAHLHVWRVHMCDMTHSYVWHDAFICVPWCIHMCDTTHSYVCRDACICVPWRIHMCAVTHSCVWHDAFVCMTHAFICA